MREVKFRAWDNSKKKMSYNLAQMGLDGFFSLNEEISILQRTHKLMQYIGLKDKNGKDIFEGDVIKCYDKDSYIILTVTWHSKLTGFSPFICSREPDWDDFDEFEVIGNIHEHPELIKL